MAFVTKTWKDRLVEYAGRRKLKNVATGEEVLMDVSRSEGTVSQAGDAFSAANMNNLEQRIKNEFDTVNSSLASIKNNIVFYNPDDDYIYINGAKWRKANLINFVLLGDDYQNPDYSWISGNNEKITFTPNGRYHILNRVLSGNTAIIWSDKNIDMSDYSKMVLRLQGISGLGQCIIGMTSKITTGTLTQSLSTYFDYSYQNSSHSGSSKVVETLEIDISSINTSVYIGLGIMDNTAQFLIMDLYLEQV